MIPIRGLFGMTKEDNRESICSCFSTYSDFCCLVVLVLLNYKVIKYSWNEFNFLQIRSVHGIKKKDHIELFHFKRALPTSEPDHSRLTTFVTMALYYRQSNGASDPYPYRHGFRRRTYSYLFSRRGETLCGFAGQLPLCVGTRNGMNAVFTYTCAAQWAYLADALGVSLFSAACTDVTLQRSKTAIRAIRPF